MTYRQAVDWLFSRLPMYQRQGKTAFRKDLTNILALSQQLKNPHEKFKSIHVGGTNGKGSVSHMIASVLQQAGYKVGLYTSPHLKNFTERIRIDGKEIPKEEVVQFVKKHQSFLESQGLSFFEMTVGLAFDFFADQQVDIAVVEVGLGGRLDSTNILKPEVSVITNIGLDHTDFLGQTLPEIAFEKAGIIKKDVPVVIGEKQDSVKEVFIKKAKQTNSKLFFASQEVNCDYPTDLLGDYQKNNVKTAILTVKKLKGFDISEKHIAEGLLKVVKNTNLKGRWQILREKPKVICDTAHNKEGLTYVLGQLKREKYQRLHVVLGFVDDKKLDIILPLFVKNAQYYFCKPNISRGLNPKILEKKATDFSLRGDVFQSVKKAYEKALENASPEDVIFVGGSTFVVAELLFTQNT